MKAENNLVQVIAPMDSAVLNQFMRIEERKYPGNRWWRIAEKIRRRRLAVLLYTLGIAGIGFMLGTVVGWQYVGAAAAPILFLVLPWAMLKTQAVPPATWQPASRACHHFGYRNANKKLNRLRSISAVSIEELVLRRPTDDYPLAAALWLVLEENGRTVRRGMDHWPL